MKKTLLTPEETVDRFRDELEGMFGAAEGHPEDAAYWWTRMTGGKANANDDGIVSIEVTPDQVERLLREHFDETVDESDLNQLASYLGMLCPSSFEVVRNDEGKDVVVEENYDE